MTATMCKIGILQNNVNLIHTLLDNRASTIQPNTLYNSILPLMDRHLPRMALEMARTRVKFSLPYNSPNTWLLWQEEVVAMQDARRTLN